MAPDENERQIGTVARLGRDFGFITSDAFPEQDLYFKTSWYRGARPLEEGASVSFEPRTYDDRVQAHFVRRVGEDAPLVRHFNPLPETAHYFDEPIDLLYDVRQGEPGLDWKHIVIDRIDRYPAEFLEDNWPSGYSQQDERAMSREERGAYFARLGRAVEDDVRTYRRIMNRIKDAVDLSVKRVSWNFKTAVPQYYPRVRALQLLLPICLVTDEAVDSREDAPGTIPGPHCSHPGLGIPKRATRLPA